MEFKRVLFLKKQMAQKLGIGSPELGEQDIFAMDALTLAYIGDACWSFFVRKALIDTGIYKEYPFYGAEKRYRRGIQGVYGI